MTQTTPNRIRVQSAEHHMNQKKSGDQHLLPEDEPMEDPHRPHRLNREDMQKLRSSEQEPDES